MAKCNYRVVSRQISSEAGMDIVMNRYIPDYHMLRRAAARPTPGTAMISHHIAAAGARIPLALAACASTLFVTVAVAEDIRLPVIADTSIAADAQETRLSYGGDRSIKLKGIENVILVDIDATPWAGKVVDSAILHLRGTDERLMVRKVGFSTVATAWNEGTSAGTEAGPGESCFLSPAMGSGSWGGPGSNFLDAVWGHGGTIHGQAYVAPAADRWYPIPLDGRLLEACASGLSHGLCISDDNGQTKVGHKDVVPTSNFSNNFFHSRERTDSAPYITATCRPAGKVQAQAMAVAISPWMGGADSVHGGAEVSWPGPASADERAATIGYRLRLRAADGTLADLPRWMHPTVPAVGERCRALLAGQPAAGALAIDVAVIGRGGVEIATGAGKGMSSPALQAAQPLALPPAAQGAAGAPPTDGRGLVFAIPDLAKANPITATVLEEPGVDYAGPAAGSWSEANPVWSGAQRIVSLAALRGEWTSFQLVCRNLQRTVTWTIATADLHGPGQAVIPAATVRLARTWYQKVGAGERAWYADPLLELAAGEPFTVPDARNAVPGQTCQTVHAELFVPKDAVPGDYSGQLQVATGDGPALPVSLHLHVGTATIPETTAFTLSMNAYNSPASGFGEVGSDAFLAAERSFYRMAHEHRTTLAVLGYSHSGTHQAGVAWPLAGEGAAMKAADWSAWDRRYGAYFDGSAFAGGPRAGVPLDHFYLPLMENWPTTMAQGYAWNDVPFEEHWKVAGPVEEGFSPRYREQWVAVLKDFRHHAIERKWRTGFQIYLNDKFFYKQYTAERKAHGQGTSFWLLDEPMHIDDFSALAFFGGLTRQAQEGDRQTVAFRVDVSRPQWGRDVIDRVVDINVTGGFSTYRPWLEDVRERYGQRIWTYGGAPSSQVSAYGIVMQAIDLYSRGVDGFVPWLTIGGEKDWTSFAATTVFYTGKPMGVAGACASLRLKAYRRGEQDIEYLRLLAAKRGLRDPSRRDLAALVSGAVKAKRTLGVLDSQGAVTESFSGMQAIDFDRLRRAIATQLDGDPSTAAP
jgi:hypothetical protein